MRRHFSGEVVYLISTFYAVHPGIQQWKNCWNLSTFARVMRHNVCPIFETETFQVSQGSAATDLRWGENFKKFLFRNSLLYIEVKNYENQSIFVWVIWVVSTDYTLSSDTLSNIHWSLLLKLAKNSKRLYWHWGLSGLCTGPVLWPQCLPQSSTPKVR